MRLAAVATRVAAIDPGLGVRVCRTRAHRNEAGYLLVAAGFDEGADVAGAERLGGVLRHVAPRDES